MMSSLINAQKERKNKKDEQKKNDDDNIITSEGVMDIDDHKDNSNTDRYHHIAVALKQECGADWQTYLNNFKNEEVTDNDLQFLSNDDVKDLITKMGPRKRFIYWMKENSKKINKNSQDKDPQLDIVFCMDCTSSMSSYIAKGKSCIINITDKVKQSEKADVQFAYVAYRDHPPQDSTFITKVHPFTDNANIMKKYIAKYGARGGGDGPEAVTAALYDALHSVKYRDNSIKIVILIADAPPHGLGCSGDGFPNGDPNGHDPVKIAKEMAAKGIILYVVACEPALSGYKFAHDLMAGLAQITEGRYLPLTGAHLLPDVIIGGAKEEVSLKKLESFVQSNMDKLKKENPDISVFEMNRKIKTKMDDHGYKYNSNNIEDHKIYGNYNRKNINAWSSANSLRSGRKAQSSIAQPQANFSYQQNQFSSMAPVDKSVVSKMMNRVNNSNNNAYY